MSEGAEFEDFLKEVWQDFETATSNAKEEDSQYNRRALIRVLVSSAEAITHVMKQRCLRRMEWNPNLFSSAEVAILREEAYFLDDSAKAVVKPSFPRTASNIKFALSLLLRGEKCGMPVDFSTAGWQAVKATIVVRNRLVHPKDSESFIVSDDEMVNAKSGAVWFIKAVMDMYKSIVLDAFSNLGEGIVEGEQPVERNKLPEAEE